jgi:hypothetical protein
MTIPKVAYHPSFSLVMSWLDQLAANQRTVKSIAVIKIMVGGIRHIEAFRTDIYLMRERKHTRWEAHSVHAALVIT